MSEHAALGASSAHRWMKCPGSVNLSAGFPDTSSPEALEGTAAHSLAQYCLNKGSDAASYIDEYLMYGVDAVSAEMAGAVQVYLDYVRSLPAGSAIVEAKIDLAPFNPPREMFGTVDYALWVPETKHLYVVDYKHGQGVLVSVHDNEQLMYYALGVILLVNARPDVVTLTVVQPRAGDEPIKSADVTWDDLVAFKKELMLRAHDTTGDNPRIGPVGSHCRWCKAKAICPAQAENALTVAGDEFAALSPVEAAEALPVADMLSKEQLIESLEAAPFVVEWIKEIRAYAIKELEAGRKVGGFKLVAKRATRKWVDEEAAERWLRRHVKMDGTYVRKLVSPAQAEKVVKTVLGDVPRNFPKFASLSSGVNLAHEDNPKREMIPATAAAEEFDAVDPT